MSEAILSDITRALKLAVFQRDHQGRLRLVGHAPEWLAALWPQVSEARGVLLPETSPFLENFLVDAALCWQAAGGDRASSGPWVELDAGGRDHHLQTTALTASGCSILVIEELGPAYAERTSIVQTAHEAALAFEKLKRAEQALAEQKRLLEQRVQERTTELAQSNATLRAEIVVRRRYAERLQGVREIDKAILAAQSPEAIAEAVLRRLQPLLPYEHASIVALDPDTGRATVLASIHEGEIASGEGWHLAGEQLAKARVLKSGKLHRINGAPNLFGTAAHDSAGGKVWPLIIDVPLLAGDTLVGVLNLATRSLEVFTQEHAEIADEVAAQLALAIRHARLFAQLSTGRLRLRALSLRLVEVQETERRFMAHELHDEIGQLLTGLKLTLELPGHETAEPPSANVSEAIVLVDELLDRVRQLSLDLRPQILDDLGLVPALDWLFKRYFKQTGIQVHFKQGFGRGRFSARLETAVFRIVQEALTNIARHAGVQEASVRLWLDEETLGVQIEDTGAGFDGEQALAGHASSGLAGMRERALMLGGEFTLEAKPGQGTRLTVEVPLAAGGATGTSGSGGVP